MHMSHTQRYRSAQHALDAGFTLVEVLVSIIVIAVGLLGIAKLEALAFSNTGVSSLRSLAAIVASSLAAIMHADRIYWGTANPTNPCTVAAPCTVAETGASPLSVHPAMLAVVLTRVLNAGWDARENKDQLDMFKDRPITDGSARHEAREIGE